MTPLDLAALNLYAAIDAFDAAQAAAEASDSFVWDEDDPLTRAWVVAHARKIEAEAAVVEAVIAARPAPEGPC